MGFSLRWLLLFQSAGSRCTGSVVMAPRFQHTGSIAVAHRLTCSTACRLLPSLQDASRPRIEPMSPALAGRFFITESPGKPYTPSSDKFVWAFPLEPFVKWLWYTWQWLRLIAARYLVLMCHNFLFLNILVSRFCYYLCLCNWAIHFKRIYTQRYAYHSP